MNIGIDIRHLVAARGGIAEYTVQLIDALIAYVPQNSYILFSAGHAPPLVARRWRGSNVVVRHMALPNRMLDAAFYVSHRPRIDRFLGGVDLFFSPHFLLTGLTSSCPRLLAIHDLSFVRFPEFFSKRDSLWHACMNPRAQAQRAAGIVTVSEATRRDLIDVWGISERAIRVVYSGIAREFFVPPNGEAREAVRRKYNLPQRFILAFSVVEPRKNYDTLIRAFELLKDAGGEKYRDISLVIAGPLSHRAASVMRSARLSHRRDDILLPGFIAEKDRPILYGLAKVFVYPSMFEGFGFPPLEAMASGVPVIVSSRASLPEISGGAALMADPYNITALANVIRELLEDETIRDYFIKAGKIRAAEFSWKITAKNMNAVFNEVRASSAT